jgi:hypothetical protein
MKLHVAIYSPTKVGSTFKLVGRGWTVNLYRHLWKSITIGAYGDEIAGMACQNLTPAPQLYKSLSYLEFYLQIPASLPAGTSHFPETHTASRLHGAPAGCGGLHTGGVKANMQTLPPVQSLSLLH